MLDQMLNLQGKVQRGCGLIVLSPDVPQEMRDKLRVTAELVFESLEILNVKEVPKTEFNQETKEEFIDAMFEATAQLVKKAYKLPFVWVEPDTTLLTPVVFEQLGAAYAAQPKRYMGGHLKIGETKFMSRLAVYPQDCFVDWENAKAMNIPFRYYAVGLSNKTPLIQNAAIKSLDDTSKVRPDAAIIHGDKGGVLIPWVAEKYKPKELPSLEDIRDIYKEYEPKLNVATSAEPKRRGRPPKITKLDCVATNGCKSSEEVQPL